jgi:hypothetical protein
MRLSNPRRRLLKPIPDAPPAHPQHLGDLGRELAADLTCTHKSPATDLPDAREQLTTPLTGSKETVAFSTADLCLLCCTRLDTSSYVLETDFVAGKRLARLCRSNSLKLASSGQPRPARLSANFLNPEVVTEAMSRQRDDAEWLKRGRQRAAVAQTLKKAMTGTEICAGARALTPHIQLRDVWHLLQQMQERDLISCLTPRLVTGRLYCLTAKGRSALHNAFGMPVNKPPSNIDWRKYSWVVRAKIRRLTLIGLGQLEEELASRKPRRLSENALFPSMESG